MDKRFFSFESNKGEKGEALLIENIENIRPLLSKEAWLIFEKLAEKPSFPAEIAKELKMNEQKVYYYIKQMKNANLIELEKTEEISGGVAKYYSVNSKAFLICTTKETKNYLQKSTKTKKAKYDGFLKEFSKNGSFVGKIVVGSPDLHGQFKARARDGHFCGEIAAYIGSNFLSYEMPLVYLDTMTKDLKEENSNLILIGGPLTNKLTNQANSFLPIKFEKENNWALKSNITGKTYGDDNIGVIEKINHPYFKNKTIVVIAGKRNTGTMAAIIALTKKEKVLAKQNENTKVQAKIIEALDLNGDGIIDDIEIKE
ncbi:MAG: hypothetical protein QXU92_01020 [Candidatus Diapherotrites archaeon]